MYFLGINAAESCQAAAVSITEYLYLSPLQGLGTDDRALIRIMVSRSEVDLFNIRKEFKETHDASLHEFIQVETMIVSRSLCQLTLLVGLLCSHLIRVSRF